MAGKCSRKKLSDFRVLDSIEVVYNGPNKRIGTHTDCSELPIGTIGIVAYFSPDNRNLILMVIDGRDFYWVYPGQIKKVQR